MVTITKENDCFVFTIKGWHKLWAFKSNITIESKNIVKAFQDAEMLKGFKGFRIPGTYIPGVIVAGNYFKHSKKTFWDVCGKKNALIIDLKNSSYDCLIIEVKNPQQDLQLLNNNIQNHSLVN